MTIRNATAIIPVKDLAAAMSWYEKVIGRGPDHAETKDRIEWLFEQGGRLQLGQAPAGKGGNGCELLSLAVGDLDFEKRRLEQSGIEVGAVKTGDGVRVLTIHDPDGNAISLAEITAQAAAAMAPATAPGTGIGEGVRGLHSLERALDSFAKDTCLRPSEVRKFLDSLILDLEALLRASEENMHGPGADAERAAQLLQRAHIVRNKLESLAAPAP
jgi:glyoxylase I family protein